MAKRRVHRVAAIAIHRGPGGNTFVHPTALPRSEVCRSASGIEPTISSADSGCHSLTKRQAEVLAWVAQGKTNSEIAEILSLKTGTVGKYLERIFAKLGVDNRTAAASFVVFGQFADQTCAVRL